MTLHVRGWKFADPSERNIAIFDLSFDVISTFRLCHLVAPGFVQAEQHSIGPSGDLFLAGVSPQAPFACVELDVISTEGAVVLAGLATASGDHVLATYDVGRKRACIEVRRDGRTRLLRRKKVHLIGAFRFAFVLCENQITVLADTGDGWKPLLTERDRITREVDLRDTAVLSTYSYAWGARSIDGTASLGAARAGLFGMTGLRDPHLVQHGDGRPYVRDGKAYLTFTCSGMGFFQQAHWGVFTLDLDDPTRLEQVAQLYSLRDGRVLGDHAGHLVRDDDNDRWIVAVSSWGDFSSAGVHVRHTMTNEDLLSGVHLLETEPTPLPTAVSSWDPALAKIDDRWHVAFVESPSQKPFDFHPALARGGPGAEWTEGLQLVGAASDLHHCEGPILANLDDQWWLLASDGTSRSYPVFDLEMHRIGLLDAPYLTSIPHPQVVPLPDGGYLMVTFDGTPYTHKLLKYGSHGNVVIMRAAAR